MEDWQSFWDVLIFFTLLDGVLVVSLWNTLQNFVFSRIFLRHAYIIGIISPKENLTVIDF